MKSKTNKRKKESRKAGKTSKGLVFSEREVRPQDQPETGKTAKANRRRELSLEERQELWDEFWSKLAREAIREVEEQKNAVD